MSLVRLDALLISYPVYGDMNVPVYHYFRLVTESRA